MSSGREKYQLSTRAAVLETEKKIRAIRATWILQEISSRRYVTGGTAQSHHGRACARRGRALCSSWNVFGGCRTLGAIVIEITIGLVPTARAGLADR